MRKSSNPFGLFVLVALSAIPITAQRPGVSPEERARRNAAQWEAVAELMAQPRPIEALNSVWIEELTWMEVRDLIREGTTTAVIPTGGIEQNGPYLATGKHNYVMDGACEGIARALGDALCAPVIKLVPEGATDGSSGSMRYPGTLSLRQETFEAVLEDVANSLQAHGFTTILFVGDSGGNQRGMRNVAERLNVQWRGSTAYYIPEFYEYARAFEYLERELGIKQPTNDGIHDDFVITSIMMADDPATVRYEQRMSAGLATINGLSIADREATREIGRKLLKFRVDYAVAAIRRRLAESG